MKNKLYRTFKYRVFFDSVNGIDLDFTGAILAILNNTPHQNPGGTFCLFVPQEETPE